MSSSAGVAAGPMGTNRASISFAGGPPQSGPYAMTGLGVGASSAITIPIPIPTPLTTTTVMGMAIRPRPAAAGGLHAGLGMGIGGAYVSHNELSFPPIDVMIFGEARKQILHLLRTDSYRRFVKSALFERYALWLFIFRKPFHFFCAVLFRRSGFSTLLPLSWNKLAMARTEP